MLKESSDGNDHNINDTQSDIIEKMIHVETDAIMSKESACSLGQPNQILENKQNQTENMTQTKVQIEPSPHSLRKIKCMHCKNHIYMLKLWKFQYDLCIN